MTEGRAHFPIEPWSLAMATGTEADLVVWPSVTRPGLSVASAIRCVPVFMAPEPVATGNSRVLSERIGPKDPEQEALLAD